MRNTRMCYAQRHSIEKRLYFFPFNVCFRISYLAAILFVHFLSSLVFVLFFCCFFFLLLVWNIFSCYLFSSQISNCSMNFSICLAFFFSTLPHTFCWHSQSFIRLFFFPSLSMCLHSKLPHPYIYEFVHKHMKFSKIKTTKRKQLRRKNKIHRLCEVQWNLRVENWLNFRSLCWQHKYFDRCMCGVPKYLKK